MIMCTSVKSSHDGPFVVSCVTRPRASAAAERLWSDRNVNDFQKAASRIEAHRCRMMR